MFTQHPEPSTETTASLDNLRSALIISGLPSNSFSIDEITRDGSDYLFVTPLFDAETQPFIATRWVWIITYDTRFLATTHESKEGYALPRSEVGTVAGRLSTIDCAPVSAIHTYFTDHNMNPEHVSVSIDGDYIQSAESETTLTVVYSPQADVPEEAQDLELKGWDEATQPNEFEQTDTQPQTVELAVAEARTVLRDEFADLDSKYWSSQVNNPEWSLKDAQ
jgi:hypothetical protein